MVIVLADRSLYAKWLFEAIVELKWHPFLRINTKARFVPTTTGFTGSRFPLLGAYPKILLARKGNSVLRQENRITLHIATELP